MPSNGNDDRLSGLPLGGPPARGPDEVYPADTVARVRTAAGEEVEVASIRVAAADLVKLREAVTALGGVVETPASVDPEDRIVGTGSVALVHPMGEDGMHLVDLRSREPGWVLRVFTTYRDAQVI